MNMNANLALSERLLSKLGALPPERLAEVEDFVDFLHGRTADRGLVRALASASEGSFNEVWNNPDDDAYDAL